MIIFHLDKILKAKRIKPLELVKLSGASRNSVYGMYKNTPKTSVTTTTLNKICNVLECELHDLIEYIPDEKEDQVQV